MDDPQQSDPFLQQPATDTVIGSLPSGGLMALTLQLAHQRSGEQATAEPT